MFDLKGAKIVVTGGTGFLGRHVVAELVAQDARVYPVGRSSYDLRARTNIDAMLRDLKPDAVVHLAAVVGGIGANQAEPGRFFYENALMGIELVDACRALNVSKLVISGTVCSYPRDTPVPFKEDSLWDGYPEETNAPYGLAKKMLLVQSQAYREQYGLNSIFLLPVNLYGAHDNFDLESSHVIPAMIRKFYEAKVNGHDAVHLWGDGTATREFIHVRDAARAFRMALKEYEGVQPVNVGSSEEISVCELAELIRKEVGYAGSIVWDKSKPNGQPRRRLETSRAKAAFGFAAEIPFSDGIRELVSWYQTQIQVL